MSIRDDPSIQFILVDGGSTDGTIELGQTFYDPSHILLGPDDGIYNAMNKGLAIAYGKYCYWLNSGDEFHPSQWPLLAHALSGLCADIHAFPVNFLRPDGSLHRVFRPTLDLLPWQTLAHQGIFIKTSTVKSLGGYREQFRISADRDLILRIFLGSGVISCHGMTVASFYIDGVSSNLSRLRIDNLKVDRALGLRGPVSFWLLWFRNIAGRLLRQCRVLFWGYPI